ncbi:ribonuclease D [Collinsella sp. AGMB00827]|uniref:Ribonuclease D n=1 Tax=Collinsella ureilytica TaxID=2869515 RepID=A0ABS7MIQ8_9ACTN|nr:ribonuclease D [Collinsella urealyticum]MBY4796975.1 ribonuclease D [Collinsella urealyticum]
MLISTFPELAKVCERARTHDAVAIDTEFIRENSYHPRLCLVQIGTEEESVLIDPFAFQDMSPLAELLEDHSTTKVFHACAQDMEVLHHALGVLPAPIFDTQIAAAFLGSRQQISYSSLVHTFCKVVLPKSESLTDWARRPLTERQKAYAIDDVYYLIQAYKKIAKRLAETGRAEWVAAETAPLARLDHYVVDPRRAYLRVKRVSALTRRQQAIARELAAWREYEASRRDIPRKWLMSDEVLVAVAKRAPETFDELKRVRGTNNLSTTAVAELLRAIQRGQVCPSEDLPAQTRSRHTVSPELESVVDLMYALIRLVSERSGVAAQLIASRDDLLAYIEHPDQSPLRDSWRFELVGPMIDDLLAGNMGLTVKDGHLELL